MRGNALPLTSVGIAEVIILNSILEVRLLFIEYKSSLKINNMIPAICDESYFEVKFDQIWLFFKKYALFRIN